MAKKRKKRSKAISFKESLQEETLEIISAIIFFVVAILLVLAAFGSAGVVGTSVYNGLTFLFGVGYFLLPVLLVFLSISFVGNLREKLGGARIFGSILFFASGLGFLGLIFEDRGGIIGQYVSNPLVALFDFWATALLLLALITVSVLIILDFRPRLSGIFSFLKRDDAKYDDVEDADEGSEDEPLDAARDDSLGTESSGRTSAESDEEYEDVEDTDVKDTDKGREEDEEEVEEESKEDPLTASQLENILAKERQTTGHLIQGARIRELANKLAGSDAEAKLIVEKHKNRIWHDHLALEDQVNEAYVLANSKKIIKIPFLSMSTQKALATLPGYVV